MIVVLSTRIRRRPLSSLPESCVGLERLPLEGESDETLEGMRRQLDVDAGKIDGSDASGLGDADAGRRDGSNLRVLEARTSQMPTGLALATGMQASARLGVSIATRDAGAEPAPAPLRC
jgi:hypothetical protein